MLDGTTIEAAQNEFVVKTYHASKFRSQVTNTQSDGYLHVTNKRVIFRAVASDSVIHSEIPIDNVSGINLYHGEYRDWIRLLIFIVVIGLLMGVVTSFSVGLSFLGNSALLWGIGLLLLALTFASSNSVAEIFYSSAPIQIGEFGHGLLAASATIVFSVFVLLGIYLTIRCIRTIPRKYSMSLAIISKGGSSTPIMIAGANPSGMVFSAAAQALEAEPGADAEALTKELGALIHDIQTLGDLGIERWKHTTPSVTA
jgi:hypothetical protein